jgi:hypothetical protein
MTVPIVLPEFTVAQIMEEAQTPDASLPGVPVSVSALNILVTLTPSIHEVQSLTSGGTAFTVYLDPMLGRVDTDGKLKGINSNPVYYDDNGTINPVPQQSSANLPVHAVFAGGYDPAYWVDEQGNQVANPAGDPVYGVRLVSNALVGLPDTLTYRVDYSKGDVLIQSFRFIAPEDDTLIDLSTVARIPL